MYMNDNTHMHAYVNVDNMSFFCTVEIGTKINYKFYYPD